MARPLRYDIQLGLRVTSKTHEQVCELAKALKKEPAVLYRTLIQKSISGYGMPLGNVIRVRDEIQRQVLELVMNILLNTEEKDLS